MPACNVARVFKVCCCGSPMLCLGTKGCTQCNVRSEECLGLVARPTKGVTAPNACFARVRVQRAQPLRNFGAPSQSTGSCSGVFRDSVWSFAECMFASMQASAGHLWGRRCVVAPLGTAAQRLERDSQDGEAGCAWKGAHSFL